MFLTSIQPRESPVVIFRSGRGVTYEHNPSEIHIHLNIHLIQVRAWKTESFHLGWKRGIWGVDFLFFQRTDWSVEEGTLWNTCSPSGCQECHKEVWWTFQMSTVKGRCLAAWLTCLFSYKETLYFYISGDKITVVQTDFCINHHLRHIRLQAQELLLTGFTADETETGS